LIDWLQRLDGRLVGSVRPHLRAIQREDFGLVDVADEPFGEHDGVLLVNARLVPSQRNFATLQRLVQSPNTAVLQGEVVVAAMLPPGRLTPQGDGVRVEPITQWLEAAAELAPLETHEADAPTLPLFNWPHEVVSWHMRLMSENMELRIAEGAFTQQQDGVFLAEGATLGPHAVIDASDGPILLDRHVRVGPFCYLSGPVYAGPGTRVIEHAALKDGVALGHTVKIGGEVEASVIEPYTNKQHHGFLGHSYLGSWINLGAGTCNSDLKNTYGSINVEYNGKRVPTNMQFMGSIIGDYAKTAINTGIFTGKVIGVGSMLYGFVTSNVPSFVNYARLFGQLAELPPEVMISTQQRMFARRQVEQRECDKQLILDMFELTAQERVQEDEATDF
jgi:glucose-1-phosphate thymidylyltransferase